MRLLKLGKALGVTFSILIIALCLYSLKSDGHHSWSKDFEYEITNIFAKYDFNKTASHAIDPENVKLPFKKSLRESVKKALDHLQFTNYYDNDAMIYDYRSNTGKEKITCKARFYGDHVMGIVVEFQNIDVSKANAIKTDFEKLFLMYEIIWVEV